MEYAIYQELERLDVADCVDPDMEVGGQPIGNFASGRVIDVVNSGDVIYDVMQMMDHSQFNEGSEAMDSDFLPMIKSYNTPEENAVGKILGKALMKKDWSKFSPQELFSELESINPELADDIAKVAKIVYNVKLEERAYKDVGVADVVKDPRGKEFKFNKDSKMFKAIDGSEEADIKTKLGKDLMRRRRNAMKRTSPSYPKNKKMMDGKSPHKKGTKKYKKHMAAMHAGMESIQNEAEYKGKKVELNKPKRGGSKKYYVYVKNPKTDRVKKISFGDVTGLKTKANNKDRAKSFAARHNCEKKNDKMKAGYWACRLPRYGLVKGGKWWQAMSGPYTQTNLSDNTFERIFDLSVDNEELVWHRDRKTRFVKVLEGVGWKFQFDNELPKEIGPGSTIHINKRCYHRLIKGSTPLKVRIVEL